MAQPSGVRRLAHVALIGALFGLVGPLSVDALWWLTGCTDNETYLRYEWVWRVIEAPRLLLWPTGIMLMGTARCAPCSWCEQQVALFSGIANMVLFSLGAMVAWSASRGLVRLGRRS